LYETQIWPVNKCSLGGNGEKLTPLIGCGKDRLRPKQGFWVKLLKFMISRQESILRNILGSDLGVILT
jgi:hypothetical protein